MTHLFSPHFQAEDANGLPYSGALLYFYTAGTTTPITTYQDYASITPHLNPVVADASGRFAPIWVGAAGYKTVLKTSAGVTLQTVDNIFRGGGPTSSTDNAIARFNSTSGEIQGSDVTLADTTGTMGFPIGGGFTFGGTDAWTHTVGTMTAATNFKVSKATPVITLNKPASGTDAFIQGTTNNLARWNISFGNATAEAGANVGSDFTISRFADNGSLIDSPIYIARSTGALTVTLGQVAFPATRNASSDANTLDDYEEGTSTPTPTSVTGTLTSASATLSYTKIGDRVFWNASITITTNGTGATSIGIAVPFTASQAAAANGLDNGVTGKSLNGLVSGANCSGIKFYDATYPGANSAALFVGGSFKTAA